MTLAFLGDAVFELMVREKIMAVGSMPVGKLHHAAVQYVCASAQAKAIDILMPNLSEEEERIFRRGRNAHGNHVPRNSNPRDYRAATGLETLFGYLYIQGENARIQELFLILWNHLQPLNSPEN